MSVDTKLEIPLARIFDSINDDFACVRRLLNKPELCMSASEVMDVIRLAIDRIHSRYEAFSQDVRIRTGLVLAERERCIGIVRREAEGWTAATIKHDMLKRIETKIEDGVRP